ncbi:hypothetical protein [Pseudomonas sp. Gutcm_11s]|uniref:hypothetical protein n=1 Tax=Pseudomonas sp. Gutcm_11s TaxID=3026088 RepID=UPI00235E5970|nr:hypothetical protein [Pseudomonas sp. Gutcm_11s]MDD0842201.1 hypothetical protein [Pseudomonas sp. Gutcm_11s]
MINVGDFARGLIKSVWLRVPSWRSLKYTGCSNTYLFLPINGAGLGHLTRSLAVARRLQQQKPDAKIVFLTTSIGVTLVHRAGFVCHHVTPAALLDESPAAWNQLFFKSIEAVLELHRPGMLVFDGTAPYLGLQRIMRLYTSIRYVWIKRGLYKVGVDQEKLQGYIELFDNIIAPGELSELRSFNEEADTKVRRVAPIALLDKEDLLERSTARRMLRLSQDRPCAYVQLGAGNINGIADMQNAVIKHLQRRGVEVVLGQSPIALKPEPNLNADSVIVDYPNSRYFSAFDFSILAGGYNSVCEAVMLGLPSLFVPNMSTGADDQLRRVEMATNFGPYKVLTDVNDRQLDLAIDSFLGEHVKSCYQGRNGAEDAARLLCEIR